MGPKGCGMGPKGWKDGKLKLLFSILKSSCVIMFCVVKVWVGGPRGKKHIISRNSVQIFIKLGMINS